MENDAPNTTPIRVYQPILYGPKPRWNDLTCSFIGGGPLERRHHCPVCHSALWLLLQLHQAPRTTQVWACNRLACWRTLFPEDEYRNALNYGGGNGVVMAIQFPNVINAATSPTSTALMEETKKKKNEWDLDGADFVGEEHESNDLSDLERQLATLETVRSIAVSVAPSSVPSVVADPVVVDASGFPGFALHALPEPPVRLSQKTKPPHSVRSDAKIQKMLQQYLQVEEDEALRQMLLQQQEGAKHLPPLGSMDPDERDEPAEEDKEAWQLYTQRLQRVPRQVIRVGGSGPLWSVPVRTDPRPLGNNSPTCSSTFAPAATVLYGYAQPIPPCPQCNAPMPLELQLLPSLLHVLRVDDFAEKEEGAVLPQGMDWGNIAIYTCRNRCPSTYCVVQDSMDGHAYAQARARKFLPVPNDVPSSASFDTSMDDDKEEGLMAEEDYGILAEDEDEEEDDNECI